MLLWLLPLATLKLLLPSLLRTVHTLPARVSLPDLLATRSNSKRHLPNNYTKFTLRMRDGSIGHGVALLL